LVSIHLWWFHTTKRKDENYKKGCPKWKKNGTYMRWIASKMMNIEIRIKKIPLANPDNVSMRP
jgi:hypothetical protein